MKSFLIIGNGAREAIFAIKLGLDSTVFAVMSHENPTIIDVAKKTGGKFIIANTNDSDVIADFVQENSIDYVFVNSDNSLASGVVDSLLIKNIKVIGPTKSGARIEWDKEYSIDIVKKLTPQFCPKYQIIDNESQIDDAINFFCGADIVVKPQGLTGGKGVKVMGEHLKDYVEVKDYINILLEGGNKILLTEKLQGFEFTIMAITDGEDAVFAPATYDYPYRFNDNKGPGTGGMGCFTSGSITLPFLSQSDFDDCVEIMRSVIKHFKEQNIHFNGVLNGGFFLTKQGIKFMEFNARFGDPESVNILSLLDGSFSKMLEAIYNKELTKSKISFLPKASVVKYLVSKDYPNKGSIIKFDINIPKIESLGIDVYFSAAKKSESNYGYETVSSSRVVALACVDISITQASNKINEAINSFIIDSGLDYRSDIAGEKELQRLNILPSFDSN